MGEKKRLTEEELSEATGGVLGKAETMGSAGEHKRHDEIEDSPLATGTGRDATRDKADQGGVQSGGTAGIV